MSTEMDISITGLFMNLHPFTHQSGAGRHDGIAGHETAEDDVVAAVVYVGHLYESGNCLAVYHLIRYGLVLHAYGGALRYNHAIFVHAGYDYASGSAAVEYAVVVGEYGAHAYGTCLTVDNAADGFYLAGLFVFGAVAKT